MSALAASSTAVVRLHRHCFEAYRSPNSSTVHRTIRPLLIYSVDSDAGNRGPTYVGRQTPMFS